MSQPQHVDLLIVGGGVTAARCARTLRRAKWAGSILLVGDEASLPYNRPPLSKEVLRDDAPVELLAAEPGSWYERQAVELRRGVAVTLLGDHAASLEDGTSLTFDRCLLATGAAPLRPPIRGAEQAMLLRTVEDALLLRTAAVQGARAVVIGGGFIGVEVASALVARGVAVTLLELSPLLWSGVLGQAVGAWAAARLAAAGVGVRLATAAASISAAGVTLGDDRLVAADFVVAGVGVTPRVELAVSRGISVDDGILTDAAGRTSLDGVWAAGDVARVDGLRVEHWHAAREAGERVARSMLGEPIPAVRAPWVFSEVCGVPIDIVGVASSFDDEIVLGDPSSDRFGSVLLSAGRPRQVASIGGWADVEALRTLLERGGSLDELRGLASGTGS
jgi:3-phenylpropionate/trans-cinnamate dioxygenase ferredoxin reductase subunit